MTEKLKAIIELNHYDGTTEFIGTKTTTEKRADGSEFVNTNSYYGALEDYDSNRYYVWKLPPRGDKGEDPNYPDMGFAPPDLILEWEDIDWSELCVARCPVW